MQWVGGMGDKECFPRYGQVGPCRHFAYRFSHFHGFSCSFTCDGPVEEAVHTTCWHHNLEARW